MPERLRHHIERSRNNPYEWTFCVGLLFLSLYGMVYEPPSTSLDEGLPPWMRLTYSLIGLAGALFTITGLRIRDAHAGLLLERIGQLAVSGGALVYAIVLCSVSTFTRSGLITVTAFAIFLGALIRVGQITRDLRREDRLLDVHLGIQDALERLSGRDEDQGEAP